MAQTRLEKRRFKETKSQSDKSRATEISVFLPFVCKSGCCYVAKTNTMLDALLPGSSLFAVVVEFMPEHAEVFPTKNVLYMKLP